jgi:D-psicose/D-tagatose/L-ribulose 3-epimerase
LAALRTAIDNCVVLGAGLLSGAIYSPLGYGTGRPPTRRELRVTADVIRRAARYASTCGVKLGIEPLNRYETSLINTGRQALDFIDLVDEPNVFLALDTFHMNIEERGFAQPIEEAGSRLCFVQLSESNRGIPGTGTVSWGEVLAALRVTAFDGPLGLESYCLGNSVVASRACVWRDVIGDADNFVGEAMRFLKGRLAEGGTELRLNDARERGHGSPASTLA